MRTFLIFIIFFCFINSQLWKSCYGYGSNRSRERDKFKSDREVLIISTLNGHLHGIDVHDGKSLWTIPNNPLVSQSLSNLEFFKDGKKFRLIPSLEGQLYMLEVDSGKKGLHALPITADALFTSSFQLSSDSLLVGGKEQRVLGFNPINGEVKYRCGKDGCHQGPILRSEKESCDLLLCRRISHVVRAVDIESGHEKWNFSVGQDDVITANTASFPHSPDGGSVEESLMRRGDCVMSKDDEEPWEDGVTQWSFNIELGIVQASSRAPFSIVRWQKELGASLSRVWMLRGGTLRPLSIFSRDAHSHLEHASDETGCPMRRSLFLGAHEGHLYVQLEDGNGLRSPRPTYVALPSSRDRPSAQTDQGLVATTRHRVSKVTRYSPPSSLHHGFFRPAMDHDESDVSKKWFMIQDNSECYPYASDPLIIRFGSFFFQKLVFLCLIIVIGHLLFKKVYLPYQMDKLRDSCLGGGVAVVSPDKSPSLTPSQSQSPWSSPSLSSDSNITSHVSRYETDYEHIRCLGRGAFGVVFEARHRVDQYHYAVKRVRVRYSPQARDKLLKEVQAFAHLEHPGIVRYYQAWFELPPDGWQEQRDQDLALVSDVTGGGDGDGGDSLSGSSGASLTCDNSCERDWSTASVGGGGDSLIIFDRSVSVDQNDTGHCLWALQASMSSSRGTESHTDTQSHADTQSQSDKHRDTQLQTESVMTETSSCSHIYLFISMHLYSGTTLQHRLQQPRPPRQTLLAIFAQIVDAVAYLHLNGLMHRDLKPSNILFDTQDHIRIVDFGLATPLVRTKSTGGRQQTRYKGLHTSNVGTELYMSPEQQRGSQYDQKVDIFALGIIFLELMVPLATGMERILLLTDARRLKFSVGLRQSHGEEVHFVSQLLDRDPTRRPSCEEILGHEILETVVADARSPVSRSRARTVSSDQGL